MKEKLLSLALVLILLFAGCSENNKTQAYAASKNGEIYHLEDCSYVKSISKNNLIWYNSEADATASGKTRCSVCFNKTPTETTQTKNNANWETIYTDDSTCFSVISYCKAESELHVCFRDSGYWYAYYDVDYSTWYSLKTASSAGNYYNKYIKNYYDCAKLK